MLLYYKMLKKFLTKYLNQPNRIFKESREKVSIINAFKEKEVSTIFLLVKYLSSITKTNQQLTF